MSQIFTDAFVDSAKMLPLLLIIYIGIEFTEVRYGSKIREKVRSAGKAGPMLGALFGIVPQCGFSVISTALYSSRLISTGTLLAVYLSTSDEAIPVILAQPDQAGVLLPLLATKLVIALAAGYGIDMVLGRSGKGITETEVCATSDEGLLAAEPPGKQTKIEEGCCGHDLAPEKPNFRRILMHPLTHTLKVFFFLFTVSLLMNFIVLKVGMQNLGSVLLGHSILQPVLVALIGLVPNCAASVAVTEVFLQGGISFGSAVSGLSAGAGLGLLVLLKENKNMTDNLRIIGLLLMVSMTAGILIQQFYG